MKKEEAIKRLEMIIENTPASNGYNYTIKANDWENYGKSRIYLSIVETRENSKHYKEKKYGYIDNKTGEYIADKYGDLEENYTFGGAAF